MNLLGIVIRGALWVGGRVFNLVVVQRRVGKTGDPCNPLELADPFSQPRVVFDGFDFSSSAFK